MSDDLISRLLAAGEPPRLTPEELARLEAHLKRPLQLSRMQRDPEYKRQLAWLREIRDYNRALGESAPPAGDPVAAPEASQAGPRRAPAEPASELLKGKHEICDALKVGVDKWRWVQKLNEQHAGPIRSQKSKQPTVRKARLLEWWAVVENRREELLNRQENRDLTGQEKPYGRGDAETIYDGEARSGAQPGMSVKKRRKGRESQPG